MNGALTSSVFHAWRTPLDFIELVQEVNVIALDPCTIASNPVGALRWFTPAEDGLKRDWWDASHALLDDSRGLVYVNPPYGRELPRWVGKCREEAARGCEILSLTPARTDTRWYREIIATATAVDYYARRITFEIDCAACAALGDQRDASRWFKRDGATVFLCTNHGADHDDQAPAPMRTKPIAGAAFPSLVSYWGPNADRFAAVFGERGDLRDLRRRAA